MQNLRLAFKGQEYVIPASKLFVVGMEIERHVSFADMQDWATKGPPTFLLSYVYAQMLGHAGVKVKPEDVREEMMAALTNPDGDSLLATVVRACSDVSKLLMTGAPESAVGEPQPGKTSAS